MKSKTKTSEAFIEAKNLLSRHSRSSYIKSYYICNALEEARDAGLITQRACSRAQGVIMERLSGYISVIHWLKQHEYIPQSTHPFNKQIQAYRHRWLKSLIKEYQAKGD